MSKFLSINYWAKKIQIFFQHYLLRKQVIKYLTGNEISDVLSDEERKECAGFLKKQWIGNLNMPFVLKYRNLPVKVRKDKKNGLYFAVAENNPSIYFKRGLSKRQVQKSYQNLLAEQDKLSPHCYSFDDFVIDSQSVIADIGAAEGIFTLKYIDKIKKAYLFEPEAAWIEALEATFAPWKEKIAIIKMFVGNKDEGDQIKLDTFFSGKEKPTIIKMDIEGNEISALEGVDELLKSGSVSDVFACSYHHSGDVERLSVFLQNIGYQTTVSKGAIFIFPESEFAEDAPFTFRKGVIHATINSI